MEKGSVEKETCWVKSNGELIDVWVIGKVVAGSKGSVAHTRFVAQDITVNRLLEAELQEKNRRLGETNVELSQRNRELDEFVYVVSHDLQEPLRTLIAFSGFLDEGLRRPARKRRAGISCGISWTHRGGCVR